MHASFVSSNLERLAFSSTDFPSASNVMAGVETEANSRKLSVAETLRQATAALETHRAWMKRRVSSTVAPLDEEARGGGVVYRDVEENGPKTVNVAWALGSGKDIKQGGENEQHPGPSLLTHAGSPTAVSPAPPPSSRARRKSATNSLDIALTPLLEEVDQFHHEENYESGSSATSPAAQGNLDLLESPTTPFHPSKGHISPNGLMETLEETASDTLHFTFQTSTRTRQSNVKVKKRQRIGKGTVVPMESSSSGHNNERTLESNKPKSPEVFVGESYHIINPPPASKLAAWGSLTSLDNYIESLESPSNKQNSVQPASAKFTNALSLRNKAEPNDENFTSAEEFAKLTFKSPNSDKELSSPSLQVQSSSMQSQEPSSPSPSKDQESGSSSFENSLSTEHFEALKATSSATVIPVTPAPKGQRSSYALHKQSKLMAAEADKKVYEFQRQRLLSLQDQNQLSGGDGASEQQSLKQRSTPGIPDSVVQTVLPKEEERWRSRKSGYAMFTKSNEQQVGDSRQELQKNYHNRDGEDTDHELPPSNLQTQQPTSVAKASSEYLAVPKDENKNKLLHKSMLVRSQSFPTKRTGVVSLHEKEDAGVEHAITGVTEELARSRSSPKLGRSTLENLNLPPLKNIIDGMELVKTLPQLKVQSPLTPHLQAFSRLSHKRERSPPLYVIHRMAGGMALPPPCPAYGTQQPEEKDVLRVISNHRGSISPDDLDALLAVGGGASSAGRRASVDIHAVGGAIDDHSSIPSENSRATLPSKDSVNISARVSSGLKERGGAGAARRSSVTALQSSMSARERFDETTVEDIETSNSLHQQPTLVPGVSYSNNETSGRSETSKAVDQSLPTSPQVTPVDYFGISAHLVSPGPGPLHLAAKSGNLRRLQSLINQGHDIDLPDQEGRTPLMYCIHSRGVHLSCADALIQEGSNLNKQSSDGSTAIHFASSVGALSLIELLFLNGANPDIRDFEGRLPLHWATIQNNPKTITLLQQHSNFDLNVTDDAGMTPLMWSAYHNNVPITSFLLDKGADREEKDIDGYTAMHWAIHRHGTDCLRLLLKADMTYFKDHRGRTVIHLAAKDGAMAACELIIKMRPDAIFDTDKQGHTPLHYAAACSRVDICALLLDLGADASQRDTDGLSPLDYARRKKLDYVVALLTCHGTAVADFARASRSTSISSILNRTVSFSQLNTDKEEEGDGGEGRDTPHGHSTFSETESLKDSSSVLSKSLTSINALGTSSQLSSRLLLEDDHQLSVSSSRLDKTADSSISRDYHHENQSVDDKEGEMEMAKGGYLGRFTNDRRDPIKHFYFWLKCGEGSICWSRLRENANRNSQRAIVLEVHEGPSTSVKKNPSYSPGDLHKYVFWVLTGGGVLDLFAYNEDAYRMWLDNVGSLAGRNAKKGIENLKLKKQSRTNNRPSSSNTRYSRATVAPVTDITNEMTSLSSTLTLGPKTTQLQGDSTLVGNGSTVSAKVNTGWGSGSHLHGRDDSGASDHGENTFSIFNRSLSVPVHLLPLTSSTPAQESSNNRQPFITRKTTQDKNINDII